ncbi:MAG: hypothetical protein HGB31_08320 [Erysipelotrichaceae bacterium]|nr:hypothetical protein [Erysipelotrichaceae bacterium]
MIDKIQEDCLFEVLGLFQELGLNKHVALIGSWAEYFYDEYFEKDYYPEIATRDIDFLYRNLRVPDFKIPLISTLKDHGFIYSENPMTRVAKFYKSNIIELEFLTRVIGQDQINYDIKSLGITSEGIRDLNLLNKYCVEIQKRGISLFVPQPAAYVVHKILINNKRLKQNKADKDMRSVRNLLEQIKGNSHQRILFQQIISHLSKKERIKFDLICIQKNLDVSSLL